jgi:hypothetical protein
MARGAFRIERGANLRMTSDLKLSFDQKQRFPHTALWRMQRQKFSASDDDKPGDERELARVSVRAVFNLPVQIRLTSERVRHTYTRLLTRALQTDAFSSHARRSTDGTDRGHTVENSIILPTLI